MAPPQNKVSYPYVPLHIQIGVTGHRDLVFTEQLEKSINDALTFEIKKILGWDENYDTPLTYSILSPLAEGADRFVARQAMKLLGAKLQAVLPMNVDEYMMDFTSDESRQEFRDMLKAGENQQQLIKKPLAAAYPGKDDKAQRILAYAKTGRYVVDNCDVLIAIWDGEPAKSNAGTGAVADYAKKKNKPMIVINANAPYEIQNQPGDENFYTWIKKAAGYITKRLLTFKKLKDTNEAGDKKPNENIRTLLKKYEQFNAYEIDSAEQAAEIEKLSGWIFFGDKTKLPHQHNITFTQKFLMPWFVKADLIALRSQRMYQRVGLLIYILSPVAVALVALGILISGVSWLFSSLEFLVLLLAYCAITIADKKKLHKKWIESRYLAEQLRCAIYFAACGFKPWFIKSSTQLHHQHQTDNWAAKMFNQLINDLPVLPVHKHADTRAGVEFIKTCWIEDQLSFHKKKKLRTGKKGRRLELAGKIVFFTALVSAMGHILLVVKDLEETFCWLASTTIFIAISFPALGASLGAIRIHREYSRLEEQSAEMIRQLEKLNEECDDVSSQLEFSKFLVKIQEKMLHDVQGWHSLMELIILESV